jgi:hypothetical protein
VPTSPSTSTSGISDGNKEVDQTRHENAHVLPPWVDSENANDTNPSDGLQRRHSCVQFGVVSFEQKSGLD